LNKNDIQYNSYIISVDIFIKYLSHAFVTLYPVNLLNNRSDMTVDNKMRKDENMGSNNSNIFDKEKEEEEEDIDATLVNKRNYDAIADSNTHQTAIDHCKNEDFQELESEHRPVKKIKTFNEAFSSSIKGTIQSLELKKPKPPLARVIDDIFNISYFCVPDFSISDICRQGQLLFMRENIEKDQYIYIFSSNFALNMASQSSYFDLGKKRNIFIIIKYY